MECTICFDVLKPANARLLRCLHCVCADCLSDMLADAEHRQAMPVCVLCHEPVDPGDVTPLTLPTEGASVTADTCGHGRKASGCLTCNCDPVCALCHTDAGHVVLAVDKLRVELTTMRNMVRGTTERMRTGREAAAQVHAELYRRLEALSEQIRATFEALQQSVAGVWPKRAADLRARHDTLQLQLTRLTDAKVKQIELQLTEFDSKLEALNVAALRSDQTLAGSDDALLAQFGRLAGRLSSLVQDSAGAPVVHASLTFTLPPLPTLNLLHRIPANVVGFCGDAARRTALTPRKLFASTPQDHPSGLVVLPDGNLLCAGTRRLLVVAPEDGQIRSTIVLPASSQAWNVVSVAVSPVTGNLWVPKHDQKIIQCVTPKGKLVQQCCCYAPSQVIVRADGSVVATSGNSIRAFDANGGVLWVSFAGGNLAHVRGMLELPSGNILIADGMLPYLQLISSSGAFLGPVGPELRSPSALAFTNDELYVASALDGQHHAAIQAFTVSSTTIGDRTETLQLRETVFKSEETKTVLSMATLFDGRVVFSQENSDCLYYL